MLRVMVVEDERIERQALALQLAGNFPGVEVAVEAANGFDAIEAAKRQKIDAAFVDVGLPGINGVDTIAAIRKVSPETAFIIVSSHDDFGYAQAAIKLGVEDYILKPASLGALAGALELVAGKREKGAEDAERETALLARMEKIKPQVETDFLYTVIQGGSGEDLARMLSFLGIEWKTALCAVVSSQSVFPPRFCESLAQSLELLGFRAIGGYFGKDLVMCAFFSAPQAENDGHFADYLGEHLRRFGSGERAVGISRAVSGVSMLGEAYREAKIAASGGGEQAGAEEMPRGEAGRKIVEKAAAYIRANYRKQISLDAVSRALRVSPFYLSRLFKQQTGKTCTELIAAERVEAAKKMLAERRSVKEACYATGFNSQNYFNKVFKKFCGMTPSEYREQSCSGGQNSSASLPSDMSK
jgi:two-component system response regulator YesN